MATNDFKTFATGGSANVLTQAQYLALANTIIANGFSAGVAPSVQLNKVWRQSSIMAAVLAQFISDRTGQDVLDDGTTATILANLKQASAAFNGALSFNASSALTVAQAGSIIYFYGSTVSQTLTLPAASSMSPGQRYSINNFASVPVTVARAGSDTILAGAGVASVVLAPGDDLQIAVANTSQWVAAGSAVRQFNPLTIAPGTQGGHATSLNQFVSSMAPSGYVKIPMMVAGVLRNFILQWGQATVGWGAAGGFTFPLAFPNAAYMGIPIVANSTGGFACSLAGITTTGMTVYHNAGSNQNIYWLALGW